MKETTETTGLTAENIELPFFVNRLRQTKDRSKMQDSIHLLGYSVAKRTVLIRG